MPRKEHDPYLPPRHYRPRGAVPIPKVKVTTKDFTASGIVGISYCKENKNKPWRADLTRKGCTIYLGYFATIEEAKEELEWEREHPTKITPPMRGISQAYLPDGTHKYHCEARIFYIDPTADMRLRNPKKNYMKVDLGLFEHSAEGYRKAKEERDKVENMLFSTIEEVIEYLVQIGKLAKINVNEITGE